MHFEREQLLAGPVEELFAFFAVPEHLGLLTPPAARLRVVRSTTPRIKQGTELVYALRAHGLPLRWRARIEVWDPPRRFVDVQLAGPFRRWRHEHAFEALADGRVRATDRIEYAPWGGALVDRLFVRRELERNFDFRARALPDAFEAWRAAR
ncbi:MAG: SRPBCC family protein [Planctomycetes bacterium]|nr:SRPBCC family protein [Planctomycetota bacterium]